MYIYIYIYIYICMYIIYIIIYVQAHMRLAVRSWSVCSLFVISPVSALHRTPMYILVSWCQSTHVSNMH